ncbi:MAG: glycosyltransferase family 39 protein [Clostridia bacterium]|nr:glycosyltransferase family 39 protein [Clostridia bacterium]
MIIEKIKDRIVTIFIIVFCLCFSWICINNIVNYFEIVYKYNKFLQVICAAIYVAVILAVSKFLVPKIQKNKIIKGLILFFIFCMTIICSIYFRVDLKAEESSTYTWDLGNYFSTAERIANGDYSNIDYLRRYPNNIMITSIFVVIIKIVSCIGVKDLILVAVICNSIIIFLAIVLMYKSTKSIYGDNIATIVLLIAMMTTPFYLYAPIFYSDTFSMFFIMLMLYFIIKINQSKGKPKRYVMNVLLGVVSFIGFEIKLTSIFLIIAFVIYTILQRNAITFVKKFLVAICVFLLCLGVYKYLTNRFITNEEESTRTPVYHWIMMGLKEEGNFNIDDYNYTDSYKFYDEKKNADIKLIKERLNEYNMQSFIRHINKKLVFTWGDGTYYAPIKLEREPHRFSRVHCYIIRNFDKTMYYKYIPQSMQHGMLFFIVISAIFTTKCRKKEDDYTIVFYITMFGFMLFLLMWENRSRYIFNILPIMLMIEARGIEFIINYRMYRRKCLCEKND